MELLWEALPRKGDHGRKPSLERTIHVYSREQRIWHTNSSLMCHFLPPHRVWNFDKRTKEGNPTLARTIRAVAPNQTQSAVMAITAHENMNMIAVGFKDGKVLLIRGNIARDRQSRLRVVHEEERNSGVYITGMAL